MGGTINFINKEQADILVSLGFKCSERKISTEQIVYSFIDTPEIRKLIRGKFKKSDYFVSKTVYL